MRNLTNTRALVIGGSSGLGKATVEALVAAGAMVTAIARDGKRLVELKRRFPEHVEIAAGDAADRSFLESIVRTSDPQSIVLTAGAHPTMARIDDVDWRTFSEPWDQDVKAAFNLVQVALSHLTPGSSVVIVSSAAALDGSPLSGSYAGAKRMQWFLSDYAQLLSTARERGVRFITVLPRPVKGSEIGLGAATAYAPQRGITPGTFMERVGVTREAVAAAILQALRGELPTDITALVVGNAGIEPID